jgi:hypothetical protein
MTRVALLVLAALVASCSVKRDETEILPWLKHRATYVGFGGFGGSTEHEYFFKYFGLWWKLDTPSAVVVTPDHALIAQGGGIAMVHRGRWSPVPLCQGQRDNALPRLSAAAVDCLSFSWSAAAPPGAPPGGVTIRRVDAEGRTIAQWELSVEGTGRTFSSGSFLRYYDDRGMPFVLVQNQAARKDFRAMPRDCALATPGPGGGTALVEGPASMDHVACERREAWEALVGRPLRDAHEHESTWPKKPR